MVVGHSTLISHMWHCQVVQLLATLWSNIFNIIPCGSTEDDTIMCIYVNLTLLTENSALGRWSIG